ncbi:hypothetical protein [Neorhodopirellula lusitana]|uniref:hypothetical protein n=1 Tax=Neorhodopirellula lusitana TaxID=445327 RepID=UPI00384ADB81
MDFSPILSHYPDYTNTESISGQFLDADVQVFVDGQRKGSRPDLTRQYGDVTLRTPIELSDRFLTIVTTDHDGFNGFDHVVLVDPVLKLAILK